jgi:hypothetical protein
VACIQVLWFCLSCIARLSQKLSIGLLEFNAFADALCTLLTYIFWWSKPFHISQPFVLPDDRLNSLLAYMWMASNTSCTRQPEPSNDHIYTVRSDPKFEAIIDERASIVGDPRVSAKLTPTDTASNQIAYPLMAPNMERQKQHNFSSLPSLRLKVFQVSDSCQ